MKMPLNVETFAKGNTRLYKQLFPDYWNHYMSLTDNSKQYDFATVDEEGNRISFAEKEEILNAEIRKEILRRANVPYAGDYPVEQWFNHPLIVHETFAVVNALVDMVLPDSVINSIGMFTDVRVGGFGDSFAFEVKPRDLFAVSKAGMGKNRGEMYKQFSGTVTVTPEFRQITVGVSLYRVLAGKESLAEFITKAQMALDAYTLFDATLGALTVSGSGGLRLSGYTQDGFIDLAQRVTAFNGGAKAVVIGTNVALNKVLPAGTAYRYMLDSEYVRLGYMRTAFGYDAIEIPQVANWQNPFFGLVKNNRLYLVSPASQKIVKLCLEGSTIANTTGNFELSTLSQTTTLMKAWGVAVATSAVAGAVDL